MPHCVVANRFQQNVSTKHCAVCLLVLTGRLYTTLRCEPLGSYSTSLYNTALYATWFPQDLSIQHCVVAS
jgi:hypothetical protein